LTEGVVEATASGPAAKDGSGTPFLLFIKWCGHPADLVYKGDVPHTDGTISKAGDKVYLQHTSNYDYIKDKAGYPDFEYSWEQ